MNTFTSIGAKLGLDISDYQKNLARAQTLAQEFAIKSQSLLRQGGLRGPARLLGFAGPIYAMVEAYRLAIERAKELKDEQDKQFDSELEHVKKIAETSKDAEQITKEWAHLEDFSKNLDKDTASALNFAAAINELKNSVADLAIKGLGTLATMGAAVGIVIREIIDIIPKKVGEMLYYAGVPSQLIPDFRGLSFQEANKVALQSFHAYQNQGTDQLANEEQAKIHQAGLDIAAKKDAEELARKNEEDKKHLEQLRELGELTGKYISLLEKEKSLTQQLADVLAAGRAAEALPATSLESQIEKQKKVNELLAQYNEITNQINDNKKQTDSLNGRLLKLNEEHAQRFRSEYEPGESQFQSGEVGSSRDRAILAQAEILKRRSQQAYAGGYARSGDYYANQADKLRNQVHSRETSEKQLSETVFKQESDDIKTELKSLNAKLDPVQVN